MARTKRRRNIPDGCTVGRGRCYWDHWTFTTWGINPVTGQWDRIPIDKQTQPKEWKKALWELHRESASGCERSPGRYYRARKEARHRGISKKELHNFLMIPDYEVMLTDNPEDCWRDWY